MVPADFDVRAFVPHDEVIPALDLNKDPSYSSVADYKSATLSGDWIAM